MSNKNFIGSQATLCTANSRNTLNELTTLTNSGIYTSREIYNNNYKGIYPKAQFGVNGARQIGLISSPIIYDSTQGYSDYPLSVNIDLIHSSLSVDAFTSIAFNNFASSIGPLTINTSANRFNITYVKEDVAVYDSSSATGWYITLESTAITSYQGNVITPNTNINLYLKTNQTNLYYSAFTLFFYSV